MSADDDDFAPAPQISRYRSVRRNSVSEVRKSVGRGLAEDSGLEEGHGIKSTFGSLNRKRAKTIDGGHANIHRDVPTTPSVPLVRRLSIKSLRRKQSFSSRPTTPSRTRNFGESGYEHTPSKRRVSLRSLRSLGRKEQNIISQPRTPNKTQFYDENVMPYDSENTIHVHEFPSPFAAGDVDDMHIDDGYDSERERRGRQDEIWREQQDRQRREREEAARWAEEVARLEAETDRIIAEQKKKDLERLQSQLAAAQASRTPQAKTRSPVFDRFPFLIRGYKSSPTTMSPASSITSRDFSRAGSLEPTSSPRSFFESRSKRSTPQRDSPPPMDNGGERRVTVRYKESSMSIPVASDTTTVDILLECSQSMGFSQSTNNPISTATSTIVEHYVHLGLERRLRRYERVQEVLNSWDRDAQNTLLILPPDTLDSIKELDISSVPRTEQPPRGFILQMHHAKKAGKWNKRFITLLEGGQIFSSKKADPNPTDKDVVTLCHLSDFDIYTPNEAHMKKHLKSPKKYCYAIKSQYKMANFATTEGFAHYFCTDDLRVAQKFHSLVQGWRSWYLVNKKAQVIEEKPPQIASTKHQVKKSVSHINLNGHRLKVSVDESPYSIGEFQPLVDLTRFDKPLDDFGKDWFLDATTKPEQPIFTSPSDANSNSVRRPLVDTRTEQPFASTGLLGDSYDQRKKELARKETFSGAGSPPLTSSPSSSQGGDGSQEQSESRSWFPSAIEHTARTRPIQEKPPSRPSTSSGVSSHDEKRRRGKPQPLLDFSTTFKDPPQWSRDGLGRGVQAVPGQYLIDLISVPQSPSSRFLAVPSRNMPLRRDASGPTLGARPQTSHGERQRSRSISTNALPFRGSDFKPLVPPVPPLPSKAAGRGGARDHAFLTMPKARGQPSERGRDTAPRELILSPSRSVTMPAQIPAIVLSSRDFSDDDDD